MSTSLDTHLVLYSLWEAIDKRKPNEGIKIDTVQRDVYTSCAFQKRQKKTARSQAVLKGELP